MERGPFHADCARRLSWRTRCFPSRRTEAPHEGSRFQSGPLSSPRRVGREEPVTDTALHRLHTPEHSPGPPSAASGAPLIRVEEQVGISDKCETFLIILRRRGGGTEHKSGPWKREVFGFCLYEHVELYRHQRNHRCFHGYLRNLIVTRDKSPTSPVQFQKSVAFKVQLHSFQILF